MALETVLGELVVERGLMRADRTSVVKGLLEFLGATLACKSSKLICSSNVEQDPLTSLSFEKHTSEFRLPSVK